MKGDALASPEWALLLLLAPGQRSPEADDQTRVLIQRGVDWCRLLELAHCHGVYPLLARSLERSAVPGVPDDVKTQLQHACRCNAVRSRLFQRELVRIAEHLAEARVPMVPLKGVSLAARLYGDLTARSSSDLDILVPRRDVGQALAILREEGYEPEARMRVGRSESDLMLESDMEIALRRHGHGVPMLVDLHWDIVWRWRNDSAAIDDLWAESRRQTLWGIEAYALSREWEILYLAVHAAHHRWAALKWLVDVHEACVAAPVDWDRLRQKASQFGWERALALTLDISHALFGTPVPSDFARRPLPRWLKLFAEPPGSQGLWGEALFAARLLDGWPERLRYLGRLAFVPTIRERRSLPLPSYLKFLYYPIRPVRLAGRWATRWFWGASAAPFEHGEGHDNEPRGLGSDAGARDGDPARLTGIGARSRRVGAGPQGESLPQSTLRV